MALEKDTTVMAWGRISKNSPLIGKTLQEISKEYKIIIEEYNDGIDYDMNDYSLSAVIKDGFYIRFIANHEIRRRVFADMGLDIKTKN